MRAKGANRMGRFSVEFEVANYDDLVDVRRHRLNPDKVRRAKLLGVVDSGATLLVLPASVAEKLGLPKADRVRVQYADRRAGSLQKVTGVWLDLQGRSGLYDAIVEPDRSTALIGAVVLETLDFLIDSKTQTLVPRDPKQITSEIESLGETSVHSSFGCRKARSAIAAP